MFESGKKVLISGTHNKERSLKRFAISRIHRGRIAETARK